MRVRTSLVVGANDLSKFFEQVRTVLFEDGDILWQLLTDALSDTVHRLIDLPVFRVALSRDMSPVGVRHDRTVSSHSCGLVLSHHKSTYALMQHTNMHKSIGCIDA